MNNPTKTWFDRINRYRVAAGFLFGPFLINMGALLTGTPIDDVLPETVRRGIYWVGLLLLGVALGMDALEVYRGRRQVKRLIRQKRKADQHPKFSSRRRR